MGADIRGTSDLSGDLSKLLRPRFLPSFPGDGKLYGLGPRIGKNQRNSASFTLGDPVIISKAALLLLEMQPSFPEHLLYPSYWALIKEVKYEKQGCCPPGAYSHIEETARYQ